MQVRIGIFASITGALAFIGAVALVLACLTTLPQSPTWYLNQAALIIVLTLAACTARITAHLRALAERTERQSTSTDAAAVARKLEALTGKRGTRCRTCGLEHFDNQSACERCDAVLA